MTVQTTARPLVVLGCLPPIAEMGLAEVLTDCGAEALVRAAGAEDLVAETRRLTPDVVIVGAGPSAGRLLARRLHAVAPSATVIVWPDDEDRMLVLSPGREAWLGPARASELMREVVAAASRKT
jgi:DNA-binding NarL/FixJ family response regulator